MIPTLFPILQGRRSTSQYGSYIFNGTDEVMGSNQISSSSNKTKLTASFWLKTSVHHSAGDISLCVGSADFFDAEEFCKIGFYNDDFMSLEDVNLSTTVALEYASGDAVDLDDQWHHWVVSCDTTLATSDNRIRFWKDNVFVSDTNLTTPGSSAILYFFESFHTINVGNFNVTGFTSYAAKRMAFIDVLDGVAALPTDFGFDDGGTWTRKPYTGSYGTYGFRLDGSNGFNDASGNGRTFTALNMTSGDNIDFNDLPPYIT